MKRISPKTERIATRAAIPTKMVATRKAGLIIDEKSSSLPLQMNSDVVVISVMTDATAQCRHSPKYPELAGDLVPTHWGWMKTTSVIMA